MDKHYFNAGLTLMQVVMICSIHPYIYMCVCVCVCARKPLQILLESIPDVEVEPCLFGLAIL